MGTFLGIVLAVLTGAMLTGFTPCNAQRFGPAHDLLVGPPPGLLPLDPIGIYGSMQKAQDCMKQVRQAASKTLNYADTLPNCLRMSFHDSSERANNSGGANGSIMQELDYPFANDGDLGVAICHSYMKTFVPSMRALGCPNLTFADAIQAHFTSCCCTL